MSAEPLSAWGLSVWAARLFAADPYGSGLCLRARPGPQRERWLAMLRALMPEGPFRRIPLAIADDRLLGGLDLAATLASGRPVAERGVLAEADGGVVVLPSAERMPPGLAARICAVHDFAEVRLERDGFDERTASRFGMVLIDEGLEEGDAPPASLMDRIAFRCDLSCVSLGDMDAASAPDPHEIGPARERLARIAPHEGAIEALCAAAAAFGIPSTRAPLLALRAARAAAAIAGRDSVADDDLAIAAQLVFSWRATALPQTEDDGGSTEDEADPGSDPSDPAGDDRDRPAPEVLEDRVVDAVRAALPPDLLARLIAGSARGAASGISGRAGALRKSGRRGRRIGSMRGDPRSGARLDLVATLRAAAPWQKIRSARQTARDCGSRSRPEIRSSDFRVLRFAERRETMTIFAVDASGSLALNRLAEAKGAVELLLADCYIRRDQVALIAFRGNRAELLLPPTRSLVRAKRSLTGLPGGGGTPLASGLDAASALALSALRRGQTPLAVLLTDGRANVARDGRPGRPAAHGDALASARALRSLNVKSLLVDTAPQPEPRASEIAEAMGASYLALPRLDAGLISGAVKVAWTSIGSGR